MFPLAAIVRFAIATGWRTRVDPQRGAAWLDQDKKRVSREAFRFRWKANAGSR
jgi:hypothetical protein